MVFVGVGFGDLLCKGCVLIRSLFRGVCCEEFVRMVVVLRFVVLWVW